MIHASCNAPYKYTIHHELCLLAPSFVPDNKTLKGDIQYKQHQCNCNIKLL